VCGEALSYDANGNLTSMPGLSLQYDSWNRLISAATESNLVLFAYDGRHRCVKRVEIQNGVGRSTIMIWGHEPSQGWGLLEERGANGELIARHVHGPSVDDLVLSELGGAVYYYHQDHLNSTIALTDASGSVIEQYRYDVFGQPFFYGPDGARRGESALGIRFLFTGREWLSSLGLYDYRHRAYSPSLGRFLQMDPLGFAAGDVNVYGSFANGPLFNADPYGLRWKPTGAPDRWTSDWKYVGYRPLELVKGSGVAIATGGLEHIWIRSFEREFVNECTGEKRWVSGGLAQYTYRSRDEVVFYYPLPDPLLPISKPTSIWRSLGEAFGLIALNAVNPPIPVDVFDVRPPLGPNPQDKGTIIREPRPPRR
jgi:RHS repeat-associated protein